MMRQIIIYCAKKKLIILVGLPALFIHLLLNEQLTSKQAFSIELTSIFHRVNKHFLLLLKITEVSRNVDIIILHIVLHIFLHFFLQIAGTCDCIYLSFCSFLLILQPFYTFIMNFLTLNFGQLLQLLDNELKNIIRNFEKQRNQIISAQYGILFNQT